MKKSLICFFYFDNDLSYCFTIFTNKFDEFNGLSNFDRLFIQHPYFFMIKIKSGFQGERAVVLPISIIEELKKNELCKLLYISDIGFYPKAGFHYRKRTKKEAEQFILIYSVEGKGWFEQNDVYHKVSSNQFFVLPKGEAHAYGSDKNDPWTIYWIHFDGSLAGFFSANLNRVHEIGIEKCSRIEDRLNLFEEIFSTLKSGYNTNNLEYATSCLFRFMGTLKFPGAFNRSNNVFSDFPEIVSMAIHYMRENLHRKVKIEEIAAYAGFSVSHFSALFHQKTGFSPISYLTHLKIQQACHYLDFTDMKVNQVSMKIGFDDPFYFSRTFRKEMNISPAEYRNKKKIEFVE